MSLSGSNLARLTSAQLEIYSHQITLLDNFVHLLVHDKDFGFDPQRFKYLATGSLVT